MPYKLGGSEAQAYFLERPLLPVEEEGAFLLAVSRLPHPGPQHLPHLLQVLLAEQGQGGCQFLRGQAPPPEGQEQLGELRVKPGLQGPGGVAPGQGVGGHVSGDHGVGGHDGPVPNGHPGEDHALPADPHVVAPHDVPLPGKLVQVGRGVLRPHPAEDVEGVGGDAADPAVGGAHDELCPRGAGAELADDQLVPKRGVVEEDVALLKLRGVFQVVVIGVVPHVDVGGGDDVFQETGRLVFVGKDRVGVWNVKHVSFLLGVVGWHHFLSVGFAVATAFLVRRYCMESSLLEKMKVAAGGPAGQGAGSAEGDLRGQAGEGDVVILAV